jgi:signal transduction histidine kinase
MLFYNPRIEEDPMKQKQNNIPEKLLKNVKVIQKFSGLLSLSRISMQIASLEGAIIMELNPPPDFCKYICQLDEMKLCPDFQSRLDPEVAVQFTCHCGLKNIIVPVKTDNQPMAYLIGGQVYTASSTYQKYLINVDMFAQQKHLLPEIVAKAIARIRSLEENEFEVHSQVINHIAKNIADTIDDTDTAITRLSLEKELLERKIIDLEAKNMSLVVNPHFLFNTLNTIARIAYFEKSHKTEELIYCLSDLLRYNLKQDMELHTIGAEIENIKKYLYIQKIRFKNRLQYEIDVPEDVNKYRIPNMIIQPIVENSLIHGITPKRDGGTIQITAEATKQFITISVCDNGYGFPPEVLQLLKDPSSITKENSKKIGIGLCSADNRLKHFFGEKYGITIIKSDYSGSTVAITIPTKYTVRR